MKPLHAIAALLTCAALLGVVIATIPVRPHNPSCPPWHLAISGNHCNQGTHR